MLENVARLAELNQTPLGEDCLALTFAAEYAGDLRHVAVWSKWLSWDGTRWLQDNTLHTFDRVSQHCREAAAKTSAQTVAAVERLAKADRRIAATADQWDADPIQIGTPKEGVACP